MEIEKRKRDTGVGGKCEVCVKNGGICGKWEAFVDNVRCMWKM